MREPGRDIGGLIAAVRAQGVRDERLLAAIAEVPRARFVPPAARPRAHLDEPIRIGHGQVTTQPSLIARMVRALELTGHEKVLEIGSGYGYQTALLARLASEVWSVERWPDMVEVAQANLASEGIVNVHIAIGDGTEGLSRQAPFDAVIVAAAFETVPPPLIAQLVPGGRLVQPIGPGGDEDVVLFEKPFQGPGLIRLKSLVAARFVRLYGRYGYPPNG